MRKSPLKTCSIALAEVAIALVVCLAVRSTDAQQTPIARPAPSTFTPPPPTPNDTLRSPELGPGGIITFRLYAPDATKVLLKAEGPEATPGIMPREMAKTMAGVPMKRSDDGIWSLEIGPIQPGVYRYTYIVDGVQTTDPKNPVSSESLNYVSSMYEVPGATFEEYTANVPHGGITSVVYHSDANGEMRRMHIYTPPGYEHDSRRYPVLYLLHGGGDTDDSWPTIGRAGAILDNLIVAHKAQPMIVVMPAGHISRTFVLRSAQNNMGHDQFNEDLTGSIIPFVDRTYRTVADRDHRALAGLSMGGLQTLTISTTHSELFASVGVFSSGWFPANQDREEATDLAQYKASGKPFKLFWVGSGEYDIARTNSDATVTLLKKYGINPVVHESGGFHAWNIWRDYLNLFAPQLFR